MNLKYLKLSLCEMLQEKKYTVLVKIADFSFMISLFMQVKYWAKIVFHE